MMSQGGGLDFEVLRDRLLRLTRLDTSVFEEVRRDPAATLPSVVVAAGATLLAGLGGWFWWLTKDFREISGAPGSGEVFIQSAILGSFFSLGLWIVWLLLAYVVLTQVFQEDADWQQMLRTMGLASAPLSLSVLMFLPVIDLGIALASVALFFGLTNIAIQAVTPAAPARVLVANLAGFTVWAIVLSLLVGEDSVLAPGIFVIRSPAEILDVLLL